jgi:cytochrome c-type biogenesis protein
MSAPVNAPAAFAAGVASFLSPCVLPLVPGYLSYVSGLSLEQLSQGGDRRLVARRAGVGALFFVLGFSTVFTALGASASAIGQWLAAYATILSRVAGVVVIVFGLHTAGVVRITALYREKRLSATGLPPGLWSSFVMGLAFAFGWTPCIGPILGTILALAATESTVARGMFLLAVYSLGLGVPFLLAALGVNAFLSFFAKYKRYFVWGERVAGALLIAIGVLILTNRLTLLAQAMPDWLQRFAK